MMKEFCKEALRYGEMGVSGGPPSYRVTVILNPAADKTRARSKFENYCEPLLHLAGLTVSTVRTEGPSSAKDILAAMEKSDAVLVAGGDGTLMETVTGFLRRPEFSGGDVTLGVLPVGGNNLMAKTLFPVGTEATSDVRMMGEAAMAVIKQAKRTVPVLEVESVKSGKKIHGLRQVQVGGLKDAERRRDKYWYLPFVKKYLTYLFTYNSTAKGIIHDCTGSIETSTVRYQMQQQQIKEQTQPPESEAQGRTGFWSYIVPASSTGSVSVMPAPAPQPTRVHDWQHLAESNVSEIFIKVGDAEGEKEESELDVYMPPGLLSLTDFVSEGWSREFNQRLLPPSEWKVAGAVQSLKWSPTFDFSDEETERMFYLDNEQVEIEGAVQVTCLPDRIKMFCCDSQNRPNAAIRDDSAPPKQPELLKHNFKMPTPSIANKFMV